MGHIQHFYPQPSEDLPTLVEQLRGALENLEQGDSSDPHTYRTYLWALVSDVWNRVALGDLQHVRVVLGALASLLGFAERHLPPNAPPTQEAAFDIHSVWQFLKLGERAMTRATTEMELDNRERSPTQREILRVFLKHQQYMRRSEVHEAMRASSRPSAVRVGQVLDELYSQQLLLRRTLPARGNAETAFYSLSPRGETLCQRLGLTAEDELLETPRNQSHPSSWAEAERRLVEQELLEAISRRSWEQRLDTRPLWHLHGAALLLVSRDLLGEKKTWSQGDLSFARLLRRFPLGDAAPQENLAAWQALAPAWPEQDSNRKELLRCIIHFSDVSNHNDLASALTSIGDKLEPRSWDALLWAPCAVTIAGGLPSSRRETVMRERLIEQANKLLSRWEEPLALHWRGRASFIDGDVDTGVRTWERLTQHPSTTVSASPMLTRRITETTDELKHETLLYISLMTFERALCRTLEIWVRDAFKNVPDSPTYRASTELVDWLWAKRSDVHELVQSRLRSLHDTKLLSATHPIMVELARAYNHWSSLSESFRQLTMRHFTQCHWLLSRIRATDRSPLLQHPGLAADVKQYIQAREQKEDEEEFRWLKQASMNNYWSGGLTILDICASFGKAQDLVPQVNGSGDAHAKHNPLG
ncbi:hypothetical protein [Archangium lipolyticum]|uniref:hypothetical protein n=1 Tax=Archangium lipolyticum TaxID=2970465 RepID=UPI002149A43D|nr:hypothetical protein [Archangium lipolyticum]